LSASINFETAQEIAEWADLLGHPLRVRLLTALATTGPGSATSFSGQFGDASVGDCHYHLRTLREAGAIELTRSRAVRGATERVYRLTPQLRWKSTQRQLREFLDLLLVQST
jgi:DNA-binding transcriptional ArsR family regulator